MTKEQQQHLERRLYEERGRALESLARLDRVLSTSQQAQDGALTAYPLHLADLGTDAGDREVAFSLASRQTDILHEIDAALERLYAKPEEFGRCRDSGREIPFSRLDLVPWAHDCEDAAVEGN